MIQRWELEYLHGDENDLSMVKDPDGDFVLYVDHQKAICELGAELAAAREALIKIRGLDYSRAAVNLSALEDDPTT